MDSRQKRQLVFHPFLFGLFPVVALFAHGIGYVLFSDTIVPAVVVLLLTSLILTLFCFIYRNVNKAGILTSVFIGLFFFYGHVHDIILEYGIVKSLIARNMLLLAAWSLIFLLVACILFRTLKELAGVTKILNVISIVLIVISLLSIFMSVDKLKRVIDISCFDIENLKSNNAETKGGGADEHFPDIYYIILDRYGNEETLKKYFDFDNSEFINYLTDKGFYVASKSISNYPNTTLSLASSLNAQYLSKVTNIMGKTPSDTDVMSAIIQNPVVLRFLKSNGYKYLHFGSWFQLTRNNRNADENYNPGLLPEFSMTLYRTTMLYPITAQLGILDKRTEQWRRTMYQFEKLEGVLQSKGPSFAFAHILVPHDPYVFDENGNFLKRDIEEKRDEKRKYIDQVKFVNKKVKALVDELLSNSKIPPVIIIQGDEGPYPASWKGNLTKLTNDEFKHKMGILNALYIPKVNKNLLHTAITPVNTFRIIFNTYFKTHLDLLPDEHYISYGDHWWRVLENSSQGARECND